MMFIHFFNIITYTALATASNITGHLRSKFDAHGSHEDQLMYYEVGNYDNLIRLIMNLFQVYLDSFVLYLIMSFTKERCNRMEKTSYDNLLKRQVPNMVFIRNQQILDEYLKGEIADREKQRKLMVLQSQLNLYLHQFNCENLGITLDLNIYSGFIQLNKSVDHSMSLENSELCSIPGDFATESHQLSIIVKQQIEIFKAEFMRGPSFFLERQTTLRKTQTEDTEGRSRSIALDFSLDKKMNKSAIGFKHNVRMKSEAN